MNTEIEKALLDNGFDKFNEPIHNTYKYPLPIDSSLTVSLIINTAKMEASVKFGLLRVAITLNGTLIIKDLENIKNKFRTMITAYIKENQ